LELISVIEFLPAENGKKIQPVQPANAI